MNYYLITLSCECPGYTSHHRLQFVITEHVTSTASGLLSNLCDTLTDTSVNPYVELSFVRLPPTHVRMFSSYSIDQLEKVTAEISVAIIAYTNRLLRSGFTLAAAPRPEASPEASPDKAGKTTLRNTVLAMLLATEDSDINYQEAASLRTVIGGEPLYQFRHADGETSYAAMQDVLEVGNPRNESDDDEDAGYIGLVPPVVGIDMSGGLVTSVWVDGSPESKYFVNDSDDWAEVNWDIIDWDAIDWDTEVAAAVTDQVERVVEYLRAWRKGEMSSELLFWLIDAAPTELVDLVSHAIITIQNCDTVSDK